MSPTWRMALYPTLIVGLVFVIFGTVAYLAINAILLGQIDTNLRDQSQSSIVYIQRFGRMPADGGNAAELQQVYFSVVEQYGVVVPQHPDIPVQKDLLQKAFAGEEVLGTQLLPDGSRARVLQTPIYIPNPNTGNQTSIAVLQSATRIGVVDRTLNGLMTFFVLTSASMLLLTLLVEQVLARRVLRKVGLPPVASDLSGAQGS